MASGFSSNFETFSVLGGGGFFHIQRASTSCYQQTINMDPWQQTVEKNKSYYKSDNLKKENAEIKE